MSTAIIIASIIAFIAIIAKILLSDPLNTEKGQKDAEEKAQREEAEAENDELPEPVSVWARVTDKSYGVEHSGNPYITSTLHHESYCILFSCDDGVERSFSVLPEDFMKIEKGSKGLLVYLGDAFYAFDTDFEE